MNCGMNNWTKELPTEEATYWVQVGSSVILCDWRPQTNTFNMYGSLKAKVKWDQRSINPITPPEL